MMAHMETIAHSDYPSLADLLPAVGAQLAVPGLEDRIGLVPAQRWVVVLVDGLGWHLVWRHLAQAGYLAQLIGQARRLHTGLPSTTATSLTSLWTGQPPGQHGILGFSFAISGASRLTLPLFARRPIPTAPSLLDRLVEAGVAVSCVVPSAHVGSGLTLMGTRAAQVVGVEIEDVPERVRAAAQAARAGQRSVVYFYEPRLDQAGHKYGVDSDQWLVALAQVDDTLERLRAGLDDEVRLLITGDHGGLDPDDRVDIDADPALVQDVRLVGGEARFRHLYTANPLPVRRRWRDRLGERAWVGTRDEAVRTGWFGPVQPNYRDRIGDVVVVAQAGLALLTRTFPAEYHLVGMHGAATPEECQVPLLID
jgi:hypothetical protein